MAQREHTHEPAGQPLALLALMMLLILIGGGLWAGGQAASLLTGRGPAAGTALSGVSALRWASAPGRAWESAMPAARTYWAITVPVALLILVAPLIVAVLIRKRFVNRRRNSPKELSKRPGMAQRNDLRDNLGTKTLQARAASLRPTLAAQEKRSKTFHPEHYGWCWGRAVGQPVWTSVRDAVVILGPSGAGKTAYIVVPRILDAPGPLIVTSIRPDVLTPTFEVRRRKGPVSVLASDGSVAGLPSVIAWSPIRGCVDGETAQARSHVLATGTSTGVENGSFWESKTEEVLKSLLHAAALGGRNIHEFWRWSLTPDTARPALDILENDDRAEAEWAGMLAGIINGDDKLRTNTWAGVRVALGGLDVSAVRHRFDPKPGEEFNVVNFLRLNGTLYLLARNSDPAGKMLSALVADITRVAKLLADASPYGRLDPPLTLMLDEIANFAPLPDLPDYLSGYGGSGIVTFAVFQDVAQVESKWGKEIAAAMWAAATISVVLGGVKSGDTLRDLMLLTGERDEETWSTSRSGMSQHSVSSNVRLRPVLDAGEIRGITEGFALMLFKGNPPALVEMTPYFRRPEAAELAEDRKRWEHIIIEQAPRVPNCWRLPRVRLRPAPPSERIGLGSMATAMVANPVVPAQRGTAGLPDLRQFNRSGDGPPYIARVSDGVRRRHCAVRTLCQAHRTTGRRPAVRAAVILGRDAPRDRRRQDRLRTRDGHHTDRARHW